MPETWKVLQTGEAEVHIARRVARLSSHLPLAVMPVVDKAVARMIAHESGGRVLEVAEAKTIETDPQLHEARPGPGRRDHRPPASGRHRRRAPLDRVRWLARPAELLALLLENRDKQESLDREHNRAMAMPADLLDALRELDLSPLAPKAVLRPALVMREAG